MLTKLTPVEASERFAALDQLRGFALFGVLMVNLLYFFRVSLFGHMVHPHSHPGWANHAVERLVAELLEFKAFDLFSLSFGIGIAVQAERARAVEMFLIRRFLVLLAVGACHLVLVSNVDILTLYAVCGLTAIPLLRLPAAALAAAGLAAICLPEAYRLTLPNEPALAAHAAVATRIYSQGSFGAILSFRWQETLDLIAPLLFGSAQRTFGLLLLGVAVWRSGVIRDAQRHKRLLWGVCVVAGVAGAFHQLSGHLPLALAYGACLVALQPKARLAAAAGRMALTNYLVQSLLFSAVFYGYGLGFFGRFEPAPVAAFGVALYAAQLWFSAFWLGRYRFGPFEWLWRSLTYGRRQPMRA